MRKLYIFGLIGLAVLILGIAWAEQITFSTYYPAPYGVYNEMRARRMAIGGGYLDSSTVTVADDNLIVEGNVGIGITNPAQQLHIRGSDAAIQLSDTTVIAGGSETSIWVLKDDGSLVLSSHARSYDDEHLVIQQGTGNVGIGTPSPDEKLEVNGAIKVGTTTGTNAGTIRWTGTVFQGYNGSDWIPLGGGGGGGGQVEVLTGTVAHGGTIPLPAGYTQAQCKWFVSINTVFQGAFASVVIRIECYANSSRVVTCRLKKSPATWYSGTANYMIIGIK